MLWRWHARAFCFAVARKAPRGPGLRELWQLVHQEPRLPVPGLLELYRSMYQVLGVCANVLVLSGTAGSSLGLFNSADDARVEFARSCRSWYTGGEQAATKLTKFRRSHDLRTSYLYPQARIGPGI